jgi:hypothetical protein
VHHRSKVGVPLDLLPHILERVWTPPSPSKSDFVTLVTWYFQTTRLLFRRHTWARSPLQDRSFDASVAVAAQGIMKYQLSKVRLRPAAAKTFPLRKPNLFFLQVFLEGQKSPPPNSATPHENSSRDPVDHFAHVVLLDVETTL